MPIKLAQSEQGETVGVNGQSGKSGLAEDGKPKPPPPSDRDVAIDLVPDSDVELAGDGKPKPPPPGAAGDGVGATGPEPKEAPSAKESGLSESNPVPVSGSNPVPVLDGPNAPESPQDPAGNDAVIGLPGTDG